MYIKSLISILIVTSSFIIAFGQTPEAKKDTEKGVRMMAWAFAGDGGYLGLQTREVNRENFSNYGLSGVRGVAVEKVMENSPAAAAGIQKDDVIVRFNGEEVTSTRKLTRLISEVAPDHQVTLTVIRGGHEQEVTATLGKHPMPKFENGNFAWATTPGEFGKIELPDMKNFPQLKDMPNGTPRVFAFPDGDGKAFTWRMGEGRQIGVGVTPLSKQLAEHFGVEGGALVSEVRENSPAAKAGLKAGDIITEINGKPVKGQFDIIRAVNEKKEGDVTLTIVRDHNRQTINVTPEKSKDGGFVFEKNDEEG